MTYNIENINEADNRMKIQSINHEPIEGTDTVLTTVIINQVPSQCILARLLIDALGKPGIDNDLEMVGSGDTWTIIWSQPLAIMDNTRKLMTKVIA
ncbi:hypothetical protein VB715_18515 [Crocosphaera sp. UHCC 0190]|uniref:hypothetical protein n=1 Tax=Crocosphaera sp. UHCC 0190 TaxID=3110246 RepID=UPI002B202C92|nr:hypothetical protein [Crocosphaera sp. UHCC 0190]MEA5511769.1 hypothetical protein [Crocosphaera sp. UHCC 0190]